MVEGERTKISNFCLRIYRAVAYINRTGTDYIYDSRELIYRKCISLMA